MNSSIGLALSGWQITWILKVHPTRKYVITSFLLGIINTYVKHNDSMVFFVLVYLTRRFKTDSHGWERDHTWGESQRWCFLLKSFFLSKVDNLLFNGVSLNFQLILCKNFLFVLYLQPNIRNIYWSCMSVDTSLQKNTFKEFYLVLRELSIDACHNTTISWECKNGCSVV